MFVNYLSFLRQRLLSLSLIISLIGLSGVSGRPNVVLFLVDDMGLMDTSVPFVEGKDGMLEKQGLNYFYRTPAMAKLAEDGVRFSSFYANSVCSPSRVSLLNGQSSARHHVTQWISHLSKNPGPPNWNWLGLKTADVTLPKLLQSAGYTTIFCGKAHLGPNGSEGVNPINLGFDINIGGSGIGHPGSYYGEENYGKGTSHAVPHLEKYHGTKTFLTEALTLEVNKAITEAHRQNKPFFVEMSHYALHAPFQSDPRFAAHYSKSGKSKEAQAFATLIEGMDKSLGDIIEHLKKIGVAEETLVLFVGDNGSDAPLGGKYEVASSAPLRGKKGTHYEGGMRVPFIAAWAQPNAEAKAQEAFPILPGVVTKDFGVLTDIMPTVLKLTGVSAPKDYVLDGEDLSSYLATHKGHRKQTFLMHFPHPHRSSDYTVFREGDWKLVYHYKKPAGKNIELFNLVKDRSESYNLAKNQPQKVAEMVLKMMAALEDAGAQYRVDKSGVEERPIPQ